MFSRLPARGKLRLQAKTPLALINAHRHSATYPTPACRPRPALCSLCLCGALSVASWLCRFDRLPMLSDQNARQAGKFDSAPHPARCSLLTAAPGRLLVALAVVEIRRRPCHTSGTCAHFVRPSRNGECVLCHHQPHRLCHINGTKGPHPPLPPRTAKTTHLSTSSPSPIIITIYFASTYIRVARPATTPGV